MRSIKFILTFFILSTISVFSQDDLIVSRSRFMQKTNPSYLGLNNMNKTGVLYNTIGLVSNQGIESRYFFGSLSFDSDYFSLGVDMYSYTLDNAGLVHTNPSLSFIYKIQLDNEDFFLPSITLGMGSNKLDTSKLVFEDQLSLVSGYLQTISNDPLAPLIGNANYLDLGASFIIHSNKYLVGLSAQHLNQPNISFNKENEEFKMPIRFSIQGAYEFDLNPYDQGFLPRYTTLYAFTNISKSSYSTDVYLSQEFQFGEFSIGLNESMKSTEAFSMLNVGISVALSYENFEFGTLYNFPSRKDPAKAYSPSTFEVFLTFDFSPYLRNRRGDYRRLSVDNYY
ncbi:MAG: hypothetical protein CMC81_05675 [Flavobacteriaceae bacterium]|nr:hypothetical protein [Flavobacteriaceae bacterium]|tara:strand:+ start:2269 stop:3285 length:1017 start_codon:yes stop_codon:yes gene_type:complete